MEANKRRIFFSGVVAGMLVSIGVFLIYTNISTQRKLRLPDSADNIRYITIEEASCDGTFSKYISDQGIESIIDIFRQIEIDFSKPEKWQGGYAGAIGRTIVLFYGDGTERRVEMAVVGEDKVIYYPSFAEGAIGYRGIWPGAKDFFQNLDYPCKRRVYVEAD